MIARFRRSELARHASILFGGVIVSNVFNYLYYMLIGRISGVEVYGVVASLLSALLVLSAPSIVVQLIVARLAADLEARGDDAAIRKLNDIAALWTAGVTAVFVAIALLERDALANYFNLSETTPIVISALSFGFMTIVYVQRGIFQGAHCFTELSTSLTIDGVTRLCIGVPLLAVFGASGALLGLAASQVVSFAYALSAFRARFGRARASLALDPSLIVRVVSHVGLGQLTFTVLMFYDVPLIKHAFDAHSAGLYAAAALVGRAVLAAISFVPTLVMPKATARAAAGHSPLPLLGAALAIAGGMAAVALAAGAFAPRVIVTLLAGNAFGAAAPLVLPYIAASCVLSLANVIAAYKMGLHRYDFVIPALAIAIVEISVFAAWHPALGAAVSVLLCGHTAILCSTLWRINAAPDVVVGVGAAGSPSF